MLSCPRFCLMLAPLLLTACGLDLTPMLGTYHGEIVADAVISTDYAVTVTQVDGDTVAVSGGDFSTFEVDIMSAAGTFTSLPDDPETTLSFVDGTISIAHDGAGGSVTFTGTLGDGGGGSGDNGGGDDNGGSDNGGGGDDNGGDDNGGGGSDEPAALADGDFRGSITGPVISANYVLTLTLVDADTVEASGDGIQPFEIPLRLSDGDVEEAGTWSQGTFLLTGDDLSLTYDPQGIAFTGSRM